MASRKRTIRCDYFTVTGPDNNFDFGKELQKFVDSSKSVTSRNLKKGDEWWRVDLFPSKSYAVGGIFLRMRSTEDEHLGSLEQEGLEGLEIEEGKYLTNYFAFAYFDESKTLVVHRSLLAGRHNRLEDYFESKTGLHPVIFNAIPNINKAFRLSKLKDQYKIVCAVAHPQDLSIVEGAGSDIMKLSKKGGKGITTEIIFRGGTLSSQIVDDVLEFINKNKPAISKAKIWGRLDGEKLPIDLIDDLMKESVDVEISGRLTPEALLEVVVDLYLRKRTEIMTMVKK